MHLFDASSQVIMKLLTLYLLGVFELEDNFLKLNDYSEI
jgi:hypothetical protein